MNTQILDNTEFVTQPKVVLKGLLPTRHVQPADVYKVEMKENVSQIF